LEDIRKIRRKPKLWLAAGDTYIHDGKFAVSGMYREEKRTLGDDCG